MVRVLVGLTPDRLLEFGGSVLLCFIQRGKESMKQMKAAQVSKAGGKFELVERNMPEPKITGANQGRSVRHLP